VSDKDEASDLSEATDLLAREFQDQLRNQVGGLIAIQRRERLLNAVATLSASVCIGLFANEASQKDPFAQVQAVVIAIFATSLIVSVSSGVAALHAAGAARELRRELLGD
jgi:hypothetical protein